MILLRFSLPDGKQWTGFFEFDGHVFTGVFSSPDPMRACVVAKGAGYWVDVGEPRKSTAIAVYPIVDVRPILAANLLLIADFKSLAAYDGNGRRWRRRLCEDELEIVSLTDSVVRGTGYDPGKGYHPGDPLRSRTEFALDIATAQVLKSED